MAFSSQTNKVVTCGEYFNKKNKECYSFDGNTWEPIQPLHELHYPSPYFTNSYFMEGIGLWVGGDDGSESFPGRMVNELQNSEGQWVTLPLDSPYQDNLYQAPCVIPLNSTHIFFSGGVIVFNPIDSLALADTWILNLESLQWTSSTPMLTTPRKAHGCVLTDTGEVLIAGGYGTYGELYSSIHIFNTVTLEWRVTGNLPSEVDTKTPSLLLWNDKVILMESNTDRIWEIEKDQGWRLMNVSMGARFDGDVNNGVLVPDSWRSVCV